MIKLLKKEILKAKASSALTKAGAKKIQSIHALEEELKKLKKEQKNQIEKGKKMLEKYSGLFDEKKIISDYFFDPECSSESFQEAINKADVVVRASNLIAKIKREWIKELSSVNNKK